MTLTRLLPLLLLAALACTSVVADAPAASTFQPPQPVDAQSEIVGVAFRGDLCEVYHFPGGVDWECVWSILHP